MQTSEATLERLFRPADDPGLNRRALAGLLVELARNLDASIDTAPTGIVPFDPRLERLRSLLLGREIAETQRFSRLLDDPEQLAIAISHVLPSAIAQATMRDDRLGQVLVPAIEEATEGSIRKDPRRLVNILHPLIVPAIGKSIGESIDATFQSFNESLKHSLSWRGLKWRFEAWRTGSTFAEVVLRHTLVYQVEHVFLIHRETGLLIAHVASADAATQDPQLVSAMLTAIQDFVRDSFSGAGQQGLDSLRLGELRLWSEAGRFATLVAVIRGNPPESLHDKLRSVLSRIHTERHAALAAFDGDTSGLADIEAALAECVSMKQEGPRSARAGFPWLFAFGVIVVLVLAGRWGVQWWLDERLWEIYVARLAAQPGIVITEVGKRDGKWQISGLRDPLAADPQGLLRDSPIDPDRVVAHWKPYQGLNPEFVLKRVTEALDPPPSVTLRIAGDRIEVSGPAPAVWLQTARASAHMLPAGPLQVDLSQVRDANAEEERIKAEEDRRWEDYLNRLRAQPGIVVAETRKLDGKWELRGLRDPLAIDPQSLLQESAVDPNRVVAHWEPYQSLSAEFVLKRVREALDAPATVNLSVKDDQIVALGSASFAWIQRARAAIRTLPVGTLHVDLAQVRDSNDEAIGKLREAIQSTTVYFDNNNPLPAKAQDAVLDGLAGQIKELAAVSSRLRITTRVTVTGHADAATGTGMFNIALSGARAEAVRALLKKRGVDPDLLAVRGAGPLEPQDNGGTETARSLNRRVTFTVGIDE